jgi:hypothetical protein
MFLTNSAENASRLGARGSEDLGDCFGGSILVVSRPLAAD